MLARAEDAVTGLLPEGWSCVRRESAPDFDLRLMITSPDGVSAFLAVEVKRRLRPGGIDAVRARLARGGSDVPVVVAEWLSPSTCRALSAAGVGYVDLTGNVELRLSRPGLLVRTRGQDNDPKPAPSALGSLKGAGAARAVRALIDYRPPYGIRALANASGASAPVLSRTAALLAADGLVVRGLAGEISAVVWVDVLRRWADDYRFPGADRAVGYLDPRGLTGFIRRLPTLTQPWAATGTLGVRGGVAVAPIALATVYVESPERAARELGLVPVQTGANVLLVGLSAAKEDARSFAGDDGIIRCAPSQVAVDLLTGPGRGPSEGEALIEWMFSNEAVWRRTL